MARVFNVRLAIRFDHLIMACKFIDLWGHTAIAY